MDPQLIWVILVVACASFIQSVSGFGFGIFAMIFLPHLMQYTEANVLSSILGSLTSIGVCLTLFRHISFRNLWFPFIGCTLTTILAVSFVKTQKNETLTLLLGFALVLLSLYFFFFSSKIKIKPTWYAGLLAGLLSGIMSGMFSMGGPPVVVYFVQTEKDSEHYLATISAYFVLTSIVSISSKVAAGFVTAMVGLAIAIGLVGLVLGAIIGKCTREKINPQLLKKLVYAIMAASGVVNIVTSLL